MGKRERKPQEASGRTPAPVFSPAVPEKAQALLTKYPEVLVPAKAPTPPSRSGLRNVTGELVMGMVFTSVLAVAAWWLLRALLSAALPDGLASWLAGGFGVLAGLFLLAGFGGSLLEPEEKTGAREWHGEYMSAADWDDEAAALMLRAQHAVRTVQESAVNERGLLDAVKNDVVLPEQLWDLGRVLEQVSVLRTQQKKIGEGLAEAQLDQILGPQGQALKRSVSAMEEKVGKLERYAEQVRNADAVLRAEAAVAIASADTDRYVELLASTEGAADSELIEELSRETKDVHSALTESLAAALDTGQTLALPAEADPGG
ncbi:hypothetical protein [Kribbella sp. CA-294648]|uniref:hypothetical protein n=1 Tax=Kribbella sp. CA-294648 TaxID=3239948 RepID=UPI003D8DE577